MKYHVAPVQMPPYPKFGVVEEWCDGMGQTVALFYTEKKAREYMKRMAADCHHPLREGKVRRKVTK